MIFLNKLLNGLVIFGLIVYFYESRANFWLALPYLAIYTAIIIPTIINNDAKYFSKLIDYIFCLLATTFKAMSKKVEIDRNSVKWGLFVGGIFYVVIVFTLLGSIASFEECLNFKGVKNVSYCYSTFERREPTGNADR